LLLITETKEGIALTVRVTPRSSKSKIVGEIDGVLKIKLKSPPVDGAANEELIRLLSKTLGVARSGVAIIAGEASRTKRISMTGISGARFTEILQAKIGRDIFTDSR
jgi:uncharacterized protein (TIGR00251 family)